MKKIWSLLVVMISIQMLYAQQSRDTLHSWMSKFSLPLALKASSNGKHIMFNKSYHWNRDTLLVLSSGRIDTVVGRNQEKLFLADHLLLVSGNSKAELLDLEKHQRKVFENVIRTGVLQSLDQYFILDKDKNMSVYNNKGSIIQKISNVEHHVADAERRLYLCAQTGNKQQLLEWDGKTLHLRYSTDHTISRLNILPSATFVAITEKERLSGKLGLKMMDKQNGRVYTPTGLSPQKADYILVSVMNNGRSFLIDYQHKEPFAADSLLEVWHGNDKKLRNYKKGVQEHQYWVWYTKDNQAVALPQDRFECFAAIHNSPYLWSFNMDERFQYQYTSKVFDIYLYDIERKSAKPAFGHTIEIVSSLYGSLTLSYNLKEKNWEIFDLNGSRSAILSKPGLSRPVFTNKGCSIIFRAEEGMWIYDTQHKTLEPWLAGLGKDVTVMNPERRTFNEFSATRLSTYSYDLAHSALLKIDDKKKSQSAYVNLSNGKVETLIDFTGDRVSMIQCDPSSNSLYSIDESYNRPGGVWFRDLKKKSKQLLYQTNLHDQQGLLFKRDIMSFRNSVGAELSGAIFYPANFDSTKKYPMVVRIYEMQQKNASAYPVPEYATDGYDRRMLLEHGYFVYQPDVLFDQRGTGISALDCVNAGLDALAGHPNIDQTKIGLTGHSMGGYETNFIATQSKRFAAFISGASVSNIIKKYFSYNFHFNIADYSRFENGQFAIGRSFAADKDLYFRNNPIHFVEQVSSPMLLWSGAKDGNVTPDHTMSFYMGLLRNQKPVIALMYKNQEHVLGWDSPESKDLNRKTLDWWGHYLKGEKPADWIIKEN